MPTRASSRLKAHQIQTQTTEPGIASTPSSKHLNNAEPSRKRQKTTAGNTKAKAVTKRSKGSGKGKKKQETFLTELPLDILFEIIEYLQPLDLLNLSYTGKELRSILTTEYAASIWKRAYMNVTPTTRGTLPPQCPSNVDIRHYTSVLFGSNCLFCAGPEGTIVHRNALTRLCNTCAQNELTFPVDFIPNKRTAPSGMDPYISELCWKAPLYTTVLKYGYYILKRDYERHASALQQCVNNEAKVHYKKVRITQKLENADFDSSLERWFTAVADQKADELRVIRDKRQESIRTKLKEEGYTSLGKYNRNMESLPGVKKTAPLTDKEWNRIKAKLIRVLELHLQDEKKQQIISAFSERLTHLSNLLKESLENQPKPWIHVALPSIAKSEPFANVIRNTDRDEHILLVQIKLAKLADHMPGVLTACRAEADEFLLDLLSGDRKGTLCAVEEGFDRTALELATTFFRCHLCIETDPISYPRILMHECLRTRTKLDPPSDEEPLEEVYGVPIVTAKHIWNRMSSWYGPTWNETCEFISIDEGATKSATAIVRACGEDPKTFTAAALKERNVRLECMRCAPPEGSAGAPRSRHIMSWNMAILHDISEHTHGISAQGWSLVTAEDDLARAKEFEDKILRSSRQKLWEHCRYCDISVRTNLNTFGAAHHLLQAHGISESEPEALKSHVYVLVDAPLDACPCAVKI